MSNVRDQLKQAHTLIRQDQLTEARQLLAPVLEENPENVHAWWLWAYAVEDPQEVREALNKVLSLDPGYREAPKAREMLQALEEQYFSTQSAVPEQIPALDQAGMESFDPDLQIDDLSEVETSQDAFGVAGDEFFDSEDALLAEFDEALQATGADPLLGVDFLAEPMPDSDVDVQVLEEFMQSGPGLGLEDEAQALAEEQFHGHVGPVRRMVQAVMTLVLIAAVVFGAWYFFLRETPGSSKDPGPLSVIEADAPSVLASVSTIGARVSAAGLAQDPEVLVVETSMGSALIVQFCHEPTPDLAEVVSQTMRIIAEESLAVSGEVKAVGISISRCAAEDADTLYRAAVAVDDAQAFVSGAYGDGEYGWVEFQNRWRKL